MKRKGGERMQTTVQSYENNMLTFQYVNFNSMKKISDFLVDVVNALEEDDSIAFYSLKIEGTNEAFKISFDYTCKDENNENKRNFKAEKISLGENDYGETIEEIYDGSNLIMIRNFIWENRKVFNKGFMETV